MTNIIHFPMKPRALIWERFINRRRWDLPVFML